MLLNRGPNLKFIVSLMAAAFLALLIVRHQPGEKLTGEERWKAMLRAKLPEQANLTNITRVGFDSWVYAYELQPGVCEPHKFPLKAESVWSIGGFTAPDTTFEVTKWFPHGRLMVSHGCLGPD